jgi:hypothetical protein
MRSALISRRTMSRNMNEALVGAIAVAVIGMVGVAFGYAWGVSGRSQAYHCPTIDGIKVSATYDGKDGQRCVYIHETYGAAKVVAKL